VFALQARWRHHPHDLLDGCVFPEHAWSLPGATREVRPGFLVKSDSFALVGDFTKRESGTRPLDAMDSSLFNRPIFSGLSRSKSDDRDQPTCKRPVHLA
jgi:hypothetical protein